MLLRRRDRHEKTGFVTDACSELATAHAKADCLRATEVVTKPLRSDGQLPLEFCEPMRSSFVHITVNGNTIRAAVDEPVAQRVVDPPRSLDPLPPTGLSSRTLHPVQTHE